MFRSFCKSCAGGGPGCEDGPGFLRGGLLRAWTAKSRGDDDPAEFDGHVVPVAARPPRRRAGVSPRGTRPPGPPPGRGHPRELAPGAAATLADFADSRWLLPGVETSCHEMVRRACGAGGYVPKAVIQATDFTVLAAAAAAGAGVALIPRMALPAPPPDLSLHPLRQPVTRTVSTLTRPGETAARHCGTCWTPSRQRPGRIRCPSGPHRRARVTEADQDLLGQCPEDVQLVRADGVEHESADGFDVPGRGGQNLLVSGLGEGGVGDPGVVRARAALNPVPCQTSTPRLRPADTSSSRPQE
jgi:hypothetical protein